MSQLSISNLDPKEVFSWFEKISQIPRGSKKEEGISNFLFNYAKKQGFEVEQDRLYNLLIRKPASQPELAHKEAVIIQAHLDMVWIKEQDYVFDFENNPIALIIDDAVVKSYKTTLGADDGIGLAYGMALLDSRDIRHPALEFVFTSQEEVGMYGAIGFDAKSLKGTTFINIDSEEEGIFCCNCCAGISMHIALPTNMLLFSTLKNKEKYSFYSIEISGLLGGHSGIEIHKERGNANSLMGRILADLEKNYSCYLSDIDGGFADNAIPSSTKACLCILNDDVDEIRLCLESWKNIFSHELSYNIQKTQAEVIFKLEVNMQSVVAKEKIYTQDTFKNVLNAMTLIPHGVATRDIVNAMPETSSNFAMIKVHDAKIVCTVSARSSILSKRQFMQGKIYGLANLLNATVTTDSEYPAWEYDEDSHIRKIFLQAYKNLYAKDAKIEGIHAGLECGVFAAKFQDKKLDMIALGPTVTGAHTPHESLNIESVKSTWLVLKEALKLLSD